jgi:hypothetical protein
MINGRPRPNLIDAIKVESLGRIVRTLDRFSPEIIKDMGDRTMVLFTDGTDVVLVDTSGYDYPRYKTPRIGCEFYCRMADLALQAMLKCKATGDEVDYVIGKNGEGPTVNPLENHPLLR